MFWYSSSLLKFSFSPNRPRLKEELHGLTYLMEILDLILKEASGEEEERTACSRPPVLLVRHYSLRIVPFLQLFMHLRTPTVPLQIQYVVHRF